MREQVNPKRKMRWLCLFFAGSFAMGTETALPQPRITSLTAASGLTWTDSIARGFYSVEQANSPAGPWSLLTTAADLDWEVGNVVTAPVPLTSGPAFYRVGWIPPQPDGIWDYYAYDRDESLVVTGRFTLVAWNLEDTNPVAYRVLGTRSLGYAGSSSSVPWYINPQVDTNSPYNTPYCSGTLGVNSSQLTMSWPTNCADCIVALHGDLWPNTYTGRWIYYTSFGPFMGRFEAFRLALTNPAAATLGPEDRREKGYDSVK